MNPLRFSSVFKSRWMALLCAAAVMWVVVRVAGPGGDAPNNGFAAAEPPDVTGATITDEDLKHFSDFAERQ